MAKLALVLSVLYCYQFEALRVLLPTVAAARPNLALSITIVLYGQSCHG